MRRTSRVAIASVLGNAMSIVDEVEAEAGALTGVVAVGEEADMSDNADESEDEGADEDEDKDDPGADEGKNTSCAASFCSCAGVGGALFVNRFVHSCSSDKTISLAAASKDTGRMRFDCIWAK